MLPWLFGDATPAVSEPPPPTYLFILVFLTHVPCAYTVWVVWRPKAPALVAACMAIGSLSHGAAQHLGPLLPDGVTEGVLEPVKGGLMGFHLAFLATFLMACFDELSFDRFCALSCPVMLSMLADSFASRDLPGVLMCGLDATCWQLPFEKQPKLNNTEELAFKLASNSVLAVGCAVGAQMLRSARDKEKTE